MKASTTIMIGGVPGTGQWVQAACDGCGSERLLDIAGGSLEMANGRMEVHIMCPVCHERGAIELRTVNTREVLGGAFSDEIPQATLRLLNAGHA